MAVFFDRDLDLELIRSQRVAILGYGSQGHAHAQNLRDRGVAVVVGAREPSSGSGPRAKQDGFSVLEVRAAVEQSDWLMLTAPDELQAEIFRDAIAPALRPGQTLAFAHGFNIHYGLITPPRGVDVVLVAPMSPGVRMREEFAAGRGVPGLVAVAQDASGSAKPRALAYAGAIGCGRIGILETSFREETETDLFAEQAVLCGGVNTLVTRAFETLVEAGYSTEVAYFCCLFELRFTVEMMHRRGVAGMREAISGTARYGDLTRGPRVIDAQVKDNLRTVLGEIQSGAFAREWLAERAAGLGRMRELMAQARAHPLERVGAELRELTDPSRAGYLPKP